jgi:nucleotidyltransferase substrate binding protein (TIGR01987 family)
MMEKNNKDIRWRQRFENFSRAYYKLSLVVGNIDQLSDLEKEGLIQRFEYTFELAWKTLKDFLESKGVDAKYPRDIIKESYRNELIDDGELWLEMLDKRNVLAHAYNEDVFRSVVNDIVKHYFDQIAMLFVLLKKDL